MRSLHLRLALISITTLSVAAALACSSSSSSDDDDDITGTDSGGGGTDATTIDATPVTDAGPADAEVPCTATPCVRQVTVGGAVSCALLDDHSIRCWGNNRSGELGSGTLDAGVVSPATMIPPVTVPGITDAIAFAATGELVGQLDTICAIVGGGGMECWGDNVYGQLGNETAGALTAIGPTPTHVLHVQSVGGGVAHVCVVTDDGGVSCWGSNYYAEVGHTNADGGNREPIPSDVPFGAAVSFTQVSGGLEHSCGVTIDHHVWCWGLNSGDQLGRIPTDGGPADHVPAQVAGIDDVKQVAAGIGSTCAVTNAGKILCWGTEQFGSLGRGETDASATSTGAAPVAIIAPASVTFTQVSPAYYGYVALASDGTVWSWGLNSVGTSGQGTLLDSGAVSPAIVGTPTMIPSLSNVTQIAGAAYGAHVCARISDGSVKCWGYDNLSQVGIAPVDGGQPYQITPVTVAF